MTNTVNIASTVSTGGTAAHEPGRLIHPSIRAVLDRLGLDAGLAPTDEAWRAFLTDLGPVIAATTERRQVRPSAETLALELAQSAGLAGGAHLIDTCSGVPNHEALMIALRNALRESSEQAEVAVLVVGLEGLARVSDRLGDAGRREVMANAAERIRSVVRAVDLVARVEGDEFAVLLGGLASAEPVRAISHRLERAFSEPLTAVGHYVYFTAHVGAALARSGSSATDAVRRGRMALEWQRSTRSHPTSRHARLLQVAAIA